MMRCYRAAAGSIELAQNGERPIVMTIFGGDRPADVPLSDFARGLHERWQLGADAPARRRDEDRAACDRLGCYLIHLPFADAVYRFAPVTRRYLYDSEQAIFGAVRDREMIDRVAEAVQARLRHASRNAGLVVPLTAGEHVDHVITRLAAERLNRGNENDGCGPGNGKNATTQPQTESQRSPTQQHGQRSGSGGGLAKAEYPYLALT